jgi:hypothetical protein
VIVDEEFLTLSAHARMTGEMILADGVARQGQQIPRRVLVAIRAADMDVIHVTEQRAAGLADKQSEEFGFGNGRMAEAQIARRIFKQDLPAQHVLDDVDIGGDDAKRLLGIGQGQQIVEIDAANSAPRQMLGDQHWIDPSRERTHAIEMR